MAHGLLMPSRGSRTWPGQNMTPRHAMVAQRPLMMRRSVHANIVHALALAGMSYAARHARAAQIIRQFRLEALANQPATRLSGGEQQRVAIARAAAIDPAVIFLDEPTAALDPAATREIEDSVQALRASGVTIIMSSHDLPQARRLADSVILLHKGRVIEAGPAADFFRKPQTDEARTFLAGDLLL
ncbi:MAG: ATP-binding cassette domain-containing protein, partial [Beijerinckiaceae bacterium]